jgi:leader peptidase (prepilin peptidase)/N-methyltransferase
MLAGTFVLRVVRRVFGAGRGIEGLGAGDADLMMMAGAFLGWQPVVVAFFVSVLPALVLGVVQVIRHGDQAMPFGPSLAAGTVLTWLCWHWIGPALQPILFDGLMMGVAAGAGVVLLFVMAVLLRLIRP